jgi:hypothetical protein
MSKKSQIRIKISHVQGVEMGTASTFTSRRKFAQSPLWHFIKENDSEGRVTVNYYENYRNTAYFKNTKELKQFLDVFLEKELIDEFTRAQEG